MFFLPSLYHRDFNRKIASFVWYSIILSSSRFFPSISHHICFFCLSLTSEWVSCSSKVVIDIGPMGQWSNQSTRLGFSVFIENNNVVI